MDKITAALAQLDPARDADWTTDGAPRIDRVKELAGDESITRKQITDIAPSLTRETAPAIEAMDEQPSEPDAGGEADAEQETTEAASETDVEPAETSADPEHASEEEPAEQTAEQEQPGEETKDEQPSVQEAVPSQSEDEQPPEQPPVAEAVKTEAQMAQEQLVTRRDQLSREINRLKQDRQQLSERIDKLTTEHDRVLTAIELNTRDNDNQSAIQEYIRSQHQTRAERMGAQREVLKGLNIETLDPRAPIDRAMARNTRRGVHRPQYATNQK